MIDVFINMWKDGWPGKALFTIFFLACLVIIWLLCTFLYWAIDSWYRPLYLGNASVTDKEHVSSHVTTTYIYVNKIMVPQITVHPESWYIYLRLEDNREGSFSCCKDAWDKVEIGAIVSVQYKEGRISNKVYIDGAQL